MNEHFSPKLENHAAATAFNYFAYNFHQDSSYTSHVSSDGRWGVTDRLWNVALWEAYELRNAERAA